MSKAQHTPVVPLKAGSGPENPPCPACGEPLFGWIEALPGLDGPVRRCESCGLGVVGEPPALEGALRELDGRRRRGALRIDDRGGFAARLGGGGWAGLEPGARLLFSIESARRLVAYRDQVVRRVRWAPGRGVALMWQTVLNGFTFGRNLGLAALGRGAAAPAARPWQRRLDAPIAVLVALPALLVALALELLAGIARRGSAAVIEVEVL